MNDAPIFSSSPLPLHNQPSRFRYRLLSVWPILATALLTAGCLPVELDVTRDGGLVICRQEGWFLYQSASGAVTKLRDVGAAVPVFARVSPDGTQLLTVAEIENGIGQFDIRIGSIGAEVSRLLLRTRNPTYLRFSPDGTEIALTRMSTERHEPGKDEEALELVLVNAETGEVRRLAKRVGPLFCWLNGGRELLAIQVVRKTDQDHLLADLVRIDVTSGNAVPIARLLGRESYHLDISPNGKQAAICAFEAGPPGSEFTAEDFPPRRLMQVDLTTGVISKSEQAAHYAIYSPDGRSLLIGSPSESGTMSRGTRLLLRDTAAEETSVLVEDAYVPDTFGPGGEVYPGWIDNARVFYFSERLVYGRTGRALSLMTVNRDGTERRCVQTAIDQGAGTE